MVTSVERLVETLNPSQTVLLFGSGSSIPSGAPSANEILNYFCTSFDIPHDGFSLREIASLVEYQQSRSELIRALRSKFNTLKPTGGLLNLPLYRWKSLYTTNYDDLIEQSFSRRGTKVTVFSSNFDFTAHDDASAISLFKLHGTIEKDISDGHRSRIILSESDYDQTNDYRETLYDRLKADLSGSTLVIIGHSLADEHIKEIVNRAAAINSDAQNGGRIVLLLYTPDPVRASLYENRNISVCFSGIDEFFAALTTRTFDPQPTTLLDDPLDRHPSLRPVTLDVSHASDPRKNNVSAMFNGWPASHSDIVAGFTFDRSIVEKVSADLRSDNFICASILGASGVGKTTAARQVLQRLRRDGYICWEHKIDYTLSTKHWIELSEYCSSENIKCVLMVDDAHSHLYEINELVDRLYSNGQNSLKLLLVATRHQWNPRVKSPTLNKKGTAYTLSQLSGAEIDRLITLVETAPAIRALVEQTFSGFSRSERRRRLVERCEADMFVCLKSIFATDSFDEIILREYADLDAPCQDVYRHVAAMEAAGVHTHRQLLIRILGIPAGSIAAILDNLTDLVNEYGVNERIGIYGWRTRHPVIANIISKFKFPDIEKIISLFDKIIDNLNPTYDIEVRTIREICNVGYGIPRIPDKDTQNRLLRKLMSVAPGERVPRHRLIRNLIEQGHYDKAETEIRIFEKDFGIDGPTYRYKINLHVSRAMNSPGLLDEDRVVLLEAGRQIAVAAVERTRNNKTVLQAYAELGIEYYRLTGRFDYFDHAIDRLKIAEDETADPDVSRIISTLLRRAQGQPVETTENEC